MKKIHIITVGASILTNFRHSGMAKFTIPAIFEDRKIQDLITNKKHKYSQILKFVEDSPYKASAELNALKKFIDNNEVDQVHLIITDTNLGKLTSSILADYFKKINIKSSHKIIPGYYKEAPESVETAEKKFVEGLSNLKINLLEFIKKTKSKGDSEIYLNATGGFKPEMSILLLVGALTNSKVYYIHEFFKQTIFIPPLFLTYLKPEIKQALIELDKCENKRIKGRRLVSIFKKKYHSIFSELKYTDLITIKSEDLDTENIKITEYGKLLAKL